MKFAELDLILEDLEHCIKSKALIMFNILISIFTYFLIHKI